MVILTKTTILDFLACEKKYQLGQVLGYQEKNKPKVMIIGTMLHLAKELFGKGVEPNKIKLKVQNEILDLFRNGMFDESTCKEIETIAFHGAYNAPWPVLPGSEFEVLIRMPMSDVMDDIYGRAIPYNFEFGGRIDEVVPVRDSVQLIDYKTKDSISNVGLSWFEKVLSLDLQQILYRKAYSKLFNINVSSFEFRYIKRPGIRQKKNESHDDYLSRMATEYASSENVTKYYSSCIALDCHSKTVTSSLLNILWRLADCYHTKVWSMNPTSCISYNHACKYLPICFAEPGWRELYDQVGSDYHPELEEKNEKRERTTEDGKQGF